MKLIILDLCGGTGSWSRPYKQSGYDVRLITLPDYDVRTYIPSDNVYGILAAPPCTEFSFAKHYHGKGNYTHDFATGLAIVDACIRIVWLCKPKFWALENPKGYLRRFIGKPRMTFDPFEYGDGYKKKTDLWGEFNFPKPKNLSIPEDAKKFSMLKTKEIHPEFYGKLSRQERRAITPSGFAKAFFDVNK